MAHSNIIPLFDGPQRPVPLAVRSASDLRETLFRAMELGTGDGIVWADADRSVLRAGQLAEEMHNLRASDISGRDVRRLFAPAGADLVAAAFKDLSDHDSWAGEVDARRLPDELFPADVTVKRIPLDGTPVFCVVVRDLSANRRLRELLRQQRSQRREMYVTLRNLMKAFGKEKLGLERGIYNKIKNLLLPSLEKIECEPSIAVRNSYLRMLRTQLIDMTRGFTRELEGRMLTLTRSEIQVCRLVQKGLATKEVAERLSLSFETVQTHRRNVRRKLGLNGRKVSLYGYLADKPVLCETDTGR